MTSYALKTHWLGHYVSTAGNVKLIGPFSQRRSRFRKLQRSVLSTTDHPGDAHRCDGDARHDQQPTEWLVRTARGRAATGETGACSGVDALLDLVAIGP